MFNCIVCTSTVTDKLWIECYLQSLSGDELQKVVHEESKKVLKFGAGELNPQLEHNWNNCILAGKHISVKSDIVENDIPLLLSKSVMKQAKIKLDSPNGIAEIFGNTV